MRNAIRPLKSVQIIQEHGKNEIAYLKILSLKKVSHTFNAGFTIKKKNANSEINRIKPL